MKSKIEKSGITGQEKKSLTSFFESFANFLVALDHAFIQI